MTSRKSTSLGFTLIEILIALFIFTILSMILVAGLHSVFTTQSSTEKSAARLADLQITLTLMSRDFEQVINRPVTSSSGTIEGPLVGTDKTVIFTHAGLANPLGQLQRSTLQRTEFSLLGGILQRKSWNALDQTTHTSATTRPLLTNVTELRFEYLDQKGNFQKRWPPEENKSDLPLAVRVFITLEDLGKISQLYIIPPQTQQRPDEKTPSPQNGNTQ